MLEPGSDRLDSWKEIADYLARDVRTVRRWERERSLPVHRMPGGGRAVVYAFRSEIDGWLRHQEGSVSANGNGRAGAGALSAALGPAAVISGILTTAVPAGRTADSELSLQSDSLIGPRQVVSWRGGRVALLAAGLVVVAALAFGMLRLLADRHTPAGRPRVIAVMFYGGQGKPLGFHIDGLGLGKPTFRMPDTRDVPYFRIGNITCFARNIGHCESGFEGDSYPLTYTAWSDTQVIIDNYQLGFTGDAVEFALWKPNSSDPKDAVVWGGNIPPFRDGTPHISEVTFGGRGKNLHMTIEGSGFGNAPPGVPGTGDTAFFQLVDYAYHLRPSNLSSYFRAGYSGDNGLIDDITLAYSSWNDSKIEINGFRGQYGDNGLDVHSGDPVAIEVWSTKTLAATVWGGRIP